MRDHRFFLAKLLPIICILKTSFLSGVITVSNPGELSTAITLANISPDTILFTSSISLIGPLPAVTGTYTIDGDNFTLTGTGTHRGFLILGATASPTILDLNFIDMLALGGNGGEAQDVRGGSGGGGLGAGGAIYVGNFASATLNNVTFDTCVATGGNAIAAAGGSNSGGGGGGGLGGAGGQGSGAGGAGGGGGGGGFLSGNDGGNGSGGTGGTGGTNGGGDGASTGVAATAGTYGGGGGGASAANNAAGVAAAGGYGGGGGGGSSRLGGNATNDAANGGYGAGGGGGGRSGGTGGVSAFGGGAGGAGVGNQGGTGGGGAGLGGAVFVDGSSSLTIVTTTDPFTASAVNAGTGANSGTTAGTDTFVAAGGELTWNISSGTVTFANPIEADTLSSSGGIEKLGIGTLNLSGLTNTYRGSTQVTTGTLQYSDDTNLGSGTLLELNGGVLEPLVTFTSAKTTSVTADSSIEVGGALEFTLSGTISGSSGLTKTGSGTFIPTGINGVYSGTTTIEEGVVTVAADPNLGTGPLVLDGGTYDVTGTFSSSRPISIIDASTIQVTGGAITLIQSGVVSSTGGALAKTGMGTLDLAAINTFTVPVTVSTGTVLLSGSGTLGSAADLALIGGGLTLAPGTGTKAIGNLTGAGTGITLNDNTLEIPSGSFSGMITGTGGISKTGGGTLTLSAATGYTGTTTISDGVLELMGAGAIASSSALTITGGSLEIATGAGTKTIGTLTGAGSGIHLNDNNINIPAGSFSGPITGAGRVNKTTAGTLTLSGPNTYSGGTEILAGTLIVGADSNLGTGGLVLLGGEFAPSSSIATSKGIAIGGASTISLAGGVDLTVNGALAGASPLMKTGGGSLRVGSGANTYTGLTTLSAGRLILDSSSFGGVLMSGGTFVEGVGTLIGDLTNPGTVSPGFSIGTISVMGDYVQTAAGTLAVEIAPSGTSDLLLVSGIATLDGTLLLEPLPGVYKAGTTYIVVSAGSIVGDFAQFVETHPLDFIHLTTGTQVLIEVLFTEAVLPVEIDDLKGNAQAMAEYLFCSDATFLPPGKDLQNVITDLVQLSPSAFKRELVLLTPEQFRALPQTGLQNGIRLADAMLSRLDSQGFEWLMRCRETEGAGIPHDFWFQPIGYYYNQGDRENGIGFNVRTFGWSSGVNFVFWDHMIVGVSANYLYSNLHWGENAGTSDLDTVQIGPSIGYINENWFANLAILGGRTFYDVDRTIAFPNIKRTAHNDHKSWDLQAAFSGGYRYHFARLLDNFYLQPEANLNFVNIFESRYQESGAESLNLSVQNKNSSFFRSLVQLNMIKEMKIKTVCLSPSIRVGWLKYVSLNNGDYTARFFKQETCKSNFMTKTNDKSTDQLLLGVELLVSPHDHLSFELEYEANIGDHFWVQEGTLRLQWDF